MTDATRARLVATAALIVVSLLAGVAFTLAALEIAREWARLMDGPG